MNKIVYILIFSISLLYGQSKNSRDILEKINGTWQLDNALNYTIETWI